MSDRIPGPAWIPSFLASLAATRTVKQAIEAAGKSQCAVYHQRKVNDRFAKAWDAARPPKPVRRATAAASNGSTRNSGWRTAFLDALAETSSITAAAKRANVPLRTVYKVRRADAAFAAGWLVALLDGYDTLEMDLLGYLRDPQPQRKMDVASALRLLAAHRETVERRRTVWAEEDQQATVESLDRFFEAMRQRRLANTAMLIEAEPADGDN